MPLTKSTTTETMVTLSSTGLPAEDDGSWKSCWRQRTLPEKILFAVIVIFFFGFLVSMVVLVEVYLRLENRLMSTNVEHHEHHPLVSSDDSIINRIVANATKEPGLCLTTECIEAASRILTGLDPHADPCQDMARFACGGWSQRQMETPGAKEVVLVLENLQTRVDHQLRLLLEAPPMPSDLKSYRKVRTYFASCMTEGDDLIRHRSVKKVIGELAKFASPADWDQASWNLTDLISRMIQVNGAPLFDIAVQVDDRNTSRYVLNVALPRQSGIMPQFYSSLPSDLLHFASQSEKSATTNESPASGRRFKRQFNFGDFGDHQELPESLLEALGLASLADEIPSGPGNFVPDADFAHNIQQLSRDQKTAAAFRLMRDVGAFDRFPSTADFQREENAIRNVIGSIDLLHPADRDKKIKQQSTKILNYFTISELQQQFGFIEWLTLLRRVVGDFIQPDETVVVHYPEVLTHIQTIVTISDQRVLHNALLMLVVRDLALELYKPPPGMEKWNFCLQASKAAFGEVLSSMYLQQFTPAQLEDYNKKAENLFNALKTSVVEMIENSSWPDAATKRKALRKANNLRPNLVAPSIYFNDTFVDETVAKVNNVRLDFVESTWQLYRIYRRDFFDIYVKLVNETTVTWQMLAYPMVANAFYLQHFNTMVLPLALLHDPLFSLETPSYLGLGTLGFIVAHEIMHGFDRAGVEFDDERVRRSLLSPSSQKIFDDKLRCVREQYSNTFKTEYSVNGSNVVLQVDGELTLNENVADLGAIRAIVATHARLTRENGPGLNLPGLNYTQEQVMLINAAQAYCAIISPQAYALILGMDEHAPPHDRVNGFMMNLPEYGRIFNCPVGSRLNPRQRCSVW